MYVIGTTFFGLSPWRDVMCDTLCMLGEAAVRGLIDCIQWRSSAPKSGGGAQTFSRKVKSKKKKKKKKKKKGHSGV